SARAPSEGALTVLRYKTALGGPDRTWEQPATNLRSLGSLRARTLRTPAVAPAASIWIFDSCASEPDGASLAWSVCVQHRLVPGALKRVHSTHRPEGEARALPPSSRLGSAVRADSRPCSRNPGRCAKNGSVHPHGRRETPHPGP